jgi:hypothetical protein
VATLRGEEVTEVDGAGTNTLVTTGTLTVNLTSLPQGFRLRLDCELVDADDAVIDTFAGVTATTTAAPLRDTDTPGARADRLRRRRPPLGAAVPARGCGARGRGGWHAPGPRRSQVPAALTGPACCGFPQNARGGLHGWDSVRLGSTGSPRIRVEGNTMRLTARAATRAGLVGGAALFAAALTLSPAQAASADLSYSCDYVYDTTEGTGAATASFDSGIGDGLVVPVGSEVSIDPFTGSVTFPDAFTALLRQNGLRSIQGGGLTLTLIDESQDPYIVELTFGPENVPAQGPLTVDVTGQGDPVVPQQAGTNTLVANDFVLGLDPIPAAPPVSSTPTATSPTTPPTSPGPSDGPAAPIDVFMDCVLTDEGDVAIDSFQATAAPTPTVTTTVTASPVRPVVVQTDFAGENRSSALPLVLGGALVVGGVGAVATGRARDSSRRH